MLQFGLTFLISLQVNLLIFLLLLDFLPTKGIGLPLLAMEIHHSVPVP